MPYQPYFRLALTVAALLCVSVPTALAQEGIFHLEEVGTRDRPMVVAVSEHGVVFIGANHQVYRSFQSTARAGQPRLWIMDVDNDRQRELVGSGRPSFLIDHNADPLWGIAEGCEQFWVGQFTADPRRELFCRRGASIELYAVDGTRLYQWTGRGFRVGTCFIDDFNGNQRLNVACNIQNNRHLFFDFAQGEPDELAGEAPDTTARSGAIDVEVHAAVLSGERELRVGRQRVTIEREGASLTWSTGEGSPVSVTLPTDRIYAIAGAALGSNAPHLYIGGSQDVYVVNMETGELVATVPADPRRMVRQPELRFRSAMANRLEDASRETIMGVLQDNIAPLRACYGERMGQDAYTRVGEAVLVLTINQQGRVTETRRQHSTIRNDHVEGCLDRAFRNIRFPAATESTGNVTVVMEFDFVDVPR